MEGNNLVIKEYRNRQLLVELNNIKIDLMEGLHADNKFSKPRI